MKFVVLSPFVMIFLLFAFAGYSGAQSSQLQGYIRWTNNQPVSGATVSIGAYAIGTDQHGHYNFGPLNPGQYTIAISPPGKPSRSFSISVGPGPVQIDFKVDW